MSGLRVVLSRSRWLTPLLLLLALGAKALIPSGAMTARAADGVVVVLCSETGVRTVALPPGDAGPERAPREHPCAFAALGMAGLIAAGPLGPGAPIRFAAPQASPVLAAAPPAPLLRLRPPLRAPPTVSA
ncbi:MAG: hypothetical protein INF91_09410 [Alphaproteobacteria bacterium]|nr:hypothetical protein [Alphaproteobacteria bacterium]